MFPSVVLLVRLLTFNSEINGLRITTQDSGIGLSNIFRDQAIDPWVYRINKNALMDSQSTIHLETVMGQCMPVSIFMSAVATPLVIMKLLAAARWAGKNKMLRLTKTVCEIYMFKPVV